jgi:hypothetical protein
MPALAVEGLTKERLAASVLNDHADVLTASLAGGDVLTWNAGTGRWVNQAAGAPGAHALVGASHTVTGLTTGHVLTALSATTFGFAAPTSPAHAMLSTTHSDSTVGTVARGDLITGQGASPTWGRLAKGTASQLLRMDGAGTDVVWASGAALTKTDDTNVTLTLGGTPTTALLAAASLTLGWTGTLADGRIASASTWNAKQTGNANLTSLAGLSYASASFVTMTAAGTFGLDTTTYAVAGAPPTAHTHDASSGLTGTTLSATVVTSSLTTVGTIGSGIWNAGAVTSSGIIESTNNANAAFRASRAGGATLNVYSGTGSTHQWDVYLSGANLRFGDNTGGGVAQFDQDITSNGGISGTTGAFSDNSGCGALRFTGGTYNDIVPAALFRVLNYGCTLTNLSLTQAGALTLAAGITCTTGHFDGLLTADLGLTVTTGQVLTVGSLGVFDGNATAPTADQFLVWSGGASKWQARSVITSTQSGVVVSSASVWSGTSVQYVNTSPTLSGTPAGGTPAKAEVTPQYLATIVDMSATTLPISGGTLTAVYDVQYSTNGGSSWSGTLTTTSSTIVHSSLTAGSSYTYQYRVRGGTTGNWSTISTAVSPLVRPEVAAFGLVLANQIAVQNLAALSANVGLLTAGTMQDATTSPLYGIKLAGSWTGGTPSVAYVDFTATGTNAFIHHAGLDLLGNGTAKFYGLIDCATTVLTGSTTRSVYVHPTYPTSYASATIYGVDIVGALSWSTGYETVTELTGLHIAMSANGYSQNGLTRYAGIHIGVLDYTALSAVYEIGGLFIDGFSKSTSYAYGIKVGDVAGSGAYYYAIYTGLGDVRFGGAFGCNGATPRSAATVGAAAPAGGTGTAAGGYNTAANRNALITLVNNIRTALINNGIAVN